MKYTYADAYAPHSHLSPNPDRLVLVESGTQVNAPAASGPTSPPPIYHVRVTHYRYDGEYLTHTYYPEQVEYFAEHHASNISTESQSSMLTTAADLLATMHGAYGVEQGLTVNDLASKIVSYYGPEDGDAEDDEDPTGYKRGDLTGRVKSELLQNGCGCGGAIEQAVRIDFEYARRRIYDHELEYRTYQQNGGQLDVVTATRPVGRWSRVTIRKESAQVSGEWKVQRRTRTWSEERLFGLGWVSYSFDPSTFEGLLHATYFNWLPVPLTIANEVTEFEPNGQEGRSWRSYFEFEQYHPTNSYGPSAIVEFALDDHGLLVYNADEENPADPVEAVTFVAGELVQWQKVDGYGRLMQRGVAEVADASTGGRNDERTTLLVDYLVGNDNLDS